MAEYKKLTINVSPDVHAELRRLADAQGITITDLIKRSVGLNRFLWEHRDGTLMLHERVEGRFREVEVLWNEIL